MTALLSKRHLVKRLQLLRILFQLVNMVRSQFIYYFIAKLTLIARCCFTIKDTSIAEIATDHDSGIGAARKPLREKTHTVVSGALQRIENAQPSSSSSKNKNMEKENYRIPDLSTSTSSVHQVDENGTSESSHLLRVDKNLSAAYRYMNVSR